MSTPTSRRPSSPTSKRGRRSTCRSTRSAARRSKARWRRSRPPPGSQFSLLPPDNATGNFTKVVQRVAVRVTFPEDVLKEVPLRPGLSVVATIHTRDADLPKPSLLGALGIEASAGKAAKP